MWIRRLRVRAPLGAQTVRLSLLFMVGEETQPDALFYERGRYRPIGPSLSAGLSRAHSWQRDQGRLVTVLPELKNAIVHRTSHEFGTVQAVLKIQNFQLLKLLLRELYLCNLLRHSALLSNSVTANWGSEAIIGSPMHENATVGPWAFIGQSRRTRPFHE